MSKVQVFENNQWSTAHDGWIEKHAAEITDIHVYPTKNNDGSIAGLLTVDLTMGRLAIQRWYNLMDLRRHLHTTPELKGLSMYYVNHRRDCGSIAIW